MLKIRKAVSLKNVYDQKSDKGYDNAEYAFYRKLFLKEYRRHKGGKHKSDTLCAGVENGRRFGYRRHCFKVGVEEETRRHDRYVRAFFDRYKPKNNEKRR